MKNIAASSQDACAQLSPSVQSRRGRIKMYPVQEWIVLICLSIIALIVGDFVLFGESEVRLFFELVVGLGLGFVAVVVGFSRFADILDGRGKIVLRGGQYQKTLISTRGLKVNEPSGDIVDLQPGEEPPPKIPFLRSLGWKWLERLFGGVWFYGWWPFDKLHLHDSTWIEVKNDLTRVSHPVIQTAETLVVDQIEGVELFGAEDKDNIPLLVILVVTVKKRNIRKALLGVSDWRDVIRKRLLTYVRVPVAQKSYEALQQADLEKIIRDAMVADHFDTESIDRHGIEILEVRVLGIDPIDQEFRKLTLQRKKGRMNADQAQEETSGRIKRSIEELHGIGIDKDKAFDAMTLQTKLDRAGYTEHKEVVEVSGLENATTAVVGGGNAGIMVGGGNQGSGKKS